MNGVAVQSINCGKLFPLIRVKGLIRRFIEVVFSSKNRIVPIVVFGRLLSSESN